jgi:hypothetical protein
MRFLPQIVNMKQAAVKRRRAGLIGNMAVPFKTAVSVQAPSSFLPLRAAEGAGERTGFSEWQDQRGHRHLLGIQ